MCFAPSRGVTRIHDPGKRQRLAFLLSLIDRLLARFRQPVVLVPHAHDTRPHNDDRELVTELARHTARPLVRPLLAPLNATEYKGIAARSTFTITERLHFGIAALSSGVPTVAIGHSWKFAGVLTDTYGMPSSPDSVYLDVRIADAAAGVRLVDRLDHDELASRLRQQLPLLRARAADNFTRAVNLLPDRPLAAAARRDQRARERA